jgi:hypothetical protein
LSAQRPACLFSSTGTLIEVLFCDLSHPVHASSTQYRTSSPSYSKASAETLVIATHKAVYALDQQTSAVLGRSMLAAEETSNTFDFLHKLVRMKDPQELAQLQSEFISRQAQVLADQTKEFGQTLMQGTSELAKTTERTAETIRKLSEAA